MLLLQQSQHDTSTWPILSVTHDTLQMPQLSCFTLFLTPSTAVAAGAYWPDAGPICLGQATHGCRWMVAGILRSQSCQPATP